MKLDWLKAASSILLLVMTVGVVALLRLVLSC